MENIKFQFSSANCLLDPSSGAAISVTTFLETLVLAGVHAKSFTATVYDRPSWPHPAENLSANGAVPLQGQGKWHRLWSREKNGVQHIILPTRSMSRARLTSAEEMRYFRSCIEFMNGYQPDCLLIYGGGLLELSLMRAAKDRGMGTFFYLANPTYTQVDTFRDIDLVFTDSAATRDLYAQRLGLESFVIGKFIKRPDLPINDVEPEYVTFVNPSYEKGATLFFRIAQLAEKILPDVRFLVVESRGSLADIEKSSSVPFSRLGNIKRVGLQKDMGAVFAQTRLLLAPSLWHESGSRTALEACSLGIPTISTDRGGFPELMGEAGIIIPPPRPLVDNHRLIPPETDAIPWVETIRQLLNEPKLYAVHSKLAQHQWHTHDPQHRIRDIVGHIREVVARGQSRYQVQGAKL
jgi:glycosyltransferase involved in cell wall biosynthesis